MKKALSVLCIALSLLFVLAGCRSARPQEEPGPSALSAERVEELRELSVSLTEYLESGDFDAAMAMMDEATTAALDGKLEGVWAQLVGSAGAFVETGVYRHGFR